MILAHMETLPWFVSLALSVFLMGGGAVLLAIAREMWKDG